MNKLLFVLLWLCLAIPTYGQTLEFCEKGFVCWTDTSGGKADTELKFDSEHKKFAVTVGPGITRYAFTESFSDLTSTWICTQNRHKYPDGKFSSWYISETEGICKGMADVLPPIVIPPVEPPPVEPPPVEPPPIELPPVEPVSVFTNVTIKKNTLTVEYSKADCPKGIKKSQSGKKTKKTMTLTCLK